MRAASLFVTSAVVALCMGCSPVEDRMTPRGGGRPMAIQDELTTEPAPEAEAGPTESPVVTAEREGEGKALGKAVPTSLELDTNRVLYLTFDDGPDEAATPMILDALKKHAIKATFFHTGSRLEETRDIVTREAAEGHIVASHQMNHVTPDTDALFVADVETERDWIEKFVPGQPRYFRYPFGAGTESRQTLLKHSGYPDGGIGWDIDSFDWCFGDGDKGTCDHELVPAAFRSDFVGWVSHQVAEKKGGVVLFHDIQNLTAKNLDRILTALEKSGYRFANLPRVRK